MKRRELSMLDEWTNLVFAGKCPGGLVVMALVSEEYADLLWVAVDERQGHLAVVFSCRDVYVEDCVHLRTDQQRYFELLNRQLGAVRILL